ncbi:hypothetical protein I4I73_27520 [Pseudonocardia sp. KRD-184]|uniref:Uncharacterized protein n=1 Tax=Pseudonocardia oceani TaxID=2792013 RepID=A0ABS6UBF6_9PSEU|nr:hypothetical protein [Pseudonocardia oceani]MBW0092948.1 hypothetical protein [Pseudonocardia oceani]MBW0099743.1 hypothetical protein [Pseudonocardia oceani]MBW0112425.1 hypothetical protein [Pseudonocardia oceani]MBW0124081.1 hypothetical protein [Pseudonocardia oceani]MBW0129550.1 hypothetical protein [Pseudonocardia oceani]
MSVEPSPAEPPADAPQPTPEMSEEQRRRLAAVFGDALPDTTGDERDPVPDDNEAQLLADRPPHHDR